MSRSYAAAALAVLALVLWMLSGQLRSETPATEAAAAPEAGPMRVEVAVMERRDVIREVVVQGHAEPWRSLALRVETAGRVEAVLVEKGRRVESGTPVLRLAEDGRRASVEEGQARVRQLQAELDAALSLEKSGLQARLRVEQARADLAAANAALARARIELDNVRLNAPFAGVLDRRVVEPGDYLDRAAVVGSLVDDSRLRVRGEVPQQSIAGLRLGQPGSVRFITGQNREGRVVYISVQADGGTRSYGVELEVDNADGALRAGMSAEIRIPVETIAAHFMSPALLSLGEKGELGVKTVSADNRVELHPVRIVRTSTEGVWVSGLPEQARVITRGQGFVRAGDTVEPVPAAS